MIIITKSFSWETRSRKLDRESLIAKVTNTTILICLARCLQFIMITPDSYLFANKISQNFCLMKIYLQSCRINRFQEILMIQIDKRNCICCLSVSSIVNTKDLALQVGGTFMGLFLRLPNPYLCQIKEINRHNLSDSILPRPRSVGVSKRVS